MDQLVPPPVEAPKVWTVTPADELLIAAKSRANRVSFALLLLFFRAHGRCPRTQDEIEPAIVADVARQLDIGLTSAQRLAGSGRTVERHRADIRTLFGFREASVADGEALTAWLRDHAVAETRDPALLASALEQRCRDLAIEPPAPERIVRIVRAALHAYDERFCDDMHRRLPAATRTRLEALLRPAAGEQPGAANDAPDDPGPAVLMPPQAHPRGPSVTSLQTARAKLGLVRPRRRPPYLFCPSRAQEGARYYPALVGAG